MYNYFKIAALTAFLLLFSGPANAGGRAYPGEKARFKDSEKPVNAYAIGSEICPPHLGIKSGAETAPAKHGGKTSWNFILPHVGAFDKKPGLSDARRVAYGKNILYRLKTIDMLFPFHTFW